MMQLQPLVITQSSEQFRNGLTVFIRVKVRLYTAINHATIYYLGECDKRTKVTKYVLKHSIPHAFPQ